MLLLSQFASLVYLFIASDVIAAFISATVLWSIRSTAPIVKRFGWLLSGFVVERVCQAVANFDHTSPLRQLQTDGHPHSSPAAWFLIWWVVGQVVRSGTIWALTLHLVGLRKQKQIG